MPKTIITCAITGSTHTPPMSPGLPWRRGDIAVQALGAAEAAAAILHQHARHPENGHTSADPEHFCKFFPDIARRCDAVINLTTGGNAIMTLDQRLRAALTCQPEMSSLNMGSMNLALYLMADKPREWLFDPEEPFCREAEDLVFKNTPPVIAGILRRMGRERGVRFEFECHDISQLYKLRHFVVRGRVAEPVCVQFVFGVLGDMGADPDTLDHRIALKDRRLGEDTMFSVLAASRRQVPMALHRARRPCPAGPGGRSLYRRGTPGRKQRRAGAADPRVAR